MWNFVEQSLLSSGGGRVGLMGCSCLGWCLAPRHDRHHPSDQTFMALMIFPPEFGAW